MATNPMKRKSRNAFILGVVITLILAAGVIALLYMKIKNQEEEIQKYVQTTSNVYVLNQDVESGQVLTSDMFTLKAVATTTIPSNSTTDVFTTLSSYTLCTSDGTPIYSNKDQQGLMYYYVRVNDVDHEIYVIDQNGKEQKATSLVADDKAYYYADANNQNKVNITISSNAVVSKVALKANTVITSSLITRTSEITTNDLRKQEYNVVSLPVDLITGDYVDIRLMLPNGQDYIVVSKKQVTVPMVAGVYLADTIQMNLNESEILTLSCAIVENYQIEGSKLYATRYTEAGIQEQAQLTYYPNNEVINLINTDPNVVKTAINEIGRRTDINDALSKYGNEENIAPGMKESMTTTLEERQQYLQSLTTY